MDILIYNDLNTKEVRSQFDKTIEALRRGDFRSADVRKLVGTDLYRARLDRENRLLFRIGQFQGRKYLFILEVILHHAYEKSRFLNGAVVDEDRLQPLDDVARVPEETVLTVPYINPRQQHFHVLDKIISFDDEQDQVFNAPTPVIIIGSAGSGKTALTLEKLKHLRGNILYVTLSPFLVENSRNLYFSNGYDNDRQEVDFLSFREYLGGIDLPEGREVTFRDFEGWIWRHQQALKIKDANKVFEEFKGVLTGSVTDNAYLTREEYLGLGVRRSVFPANERGGIYDLFLKYLDFLKDSSLYDANLAAYERLGRVQPRYDFVVVDEVQDITNVQLMLILKSLKNPLNFMLCGDSNQVVHPNFFSWANIKSLFYEQQLPANLTRILYTNYRNTPEVTRIANQLLLVKNARFGSIDKESTYLVRANSASRGVVEFYEDKPANKQELDHRTGRSARFAVLVMRNEDKAEARRFFHTPLLFSVQEAKGLEYENIILYNFISQNEREFRELCAGVGAADLEGDITFSRARDKSDKALEVYKFYVNSLYVAITRAVKNLYVVERARKHELLQLLGLTNFKDKVAMQDQQSSMEEWQREARRLELQGKAEQAADIRKQILRTEPVPWEVTDVPKFDQLLAEALNPDHFNKKAKDRLYEYALMYYETSVFARLAALKYRRAEQWQIDGTGRIERKYNEFFRDDVNTVQAKVRKYGPNYRTEFNLTPLMMATLGGSVKIIGYLLEVGADPALRDNLGRQAFQLALLKAYQQPKYARQILERVYQPLRPGSVNVKFGHHLHVLQPHQMEYFIFHYMVALTREITTFKIQHDIPGFQAADIMTGIEHYPSRLMAEYRKKRTYVSAILAKNEIYRDDPYNRRLFMRITRGYYLLNPLLEIETPQGWTNIYDLLRMPHLTGSEDPTQRHFGQWIQDQRAFLQQNYKG